MNNAARVWALEKRYKRAKRRAKRYSRRVRDLNDKIGRQLEIMQTANDEQKKILREMKVDEILGDP